MTHSLPRSVKQFLPVVREAARPLEGRAFLALVLIFSQVAYGAPQSRLGALSSAAGSSSAQQSSAAPQAPAPAPAAAPLPDAVQTEQERSAKEAKTPKTPQLTAPTPGKTLELTDFQLLVQSSLGLALPIYGASLFENVPSTFAPVDHIPVTADYVIGPGDELMIRAWGQIDLDVHARVDRNGNIFLPKVGSVSVSGLKYAQIENFMKDHIGRIYQNFDLNVTMGELRSIDIYVVGQVSRPGRYTVSSLSTLTNAIFACGGPSPHGSMRQIQLKRGGKAVTTFDLYDLLLNGDKSKDVVLQPEDVIYVAPVGPQVALGGQVNVPAVYELKTETKLSEVIRLAGGLTNTAFGGKVYIEHIVDHRVHNVEEVPLDSAGLVHPLVDGDIVNFTAISPKFENSVTLRGNVGAPGRYPWHAGMRISDLIPNREFLITREYWKQQNAIVLESETTGGHVTGTTGTVNSVKRNAPEIDWDYAVVQRMSEQDLSTQLIPFNLGKAILGQDAASNVVLQSGDIITIFSQADLKVPEGQQTKLISLGGEFASSGVYRVMPGEKLRDIVNRAGGLAPSAYLYASEFTRESARVEASFKKAPAYVRYQRPPVEETLEPLILESGERLAGEIKYYDYGVVSVLFELPFSGEWDTLVELVGRWISDTNFEKLAERIVRQKVERARPALIKPYSTNWLTRTTSSSTFARSHGAPSADELLTSSGHQIAQVVRGENATLSDGERQRSSAVRMSYYPNDVAGHRMECRLRLRLQCRRRNHHPAARIRQLPAARVPPLRRAAHQGTRQASTTPRTRRQR